MSPPRVVLFDIGGVVVGSPLVGINAFEAQHGLPHDYLNVAITARGRGGAFQRFERSELDVHSFYAAFGRELSDVQKGNEAYREFCRRRGVDVPQLPRELKVDGRELFGRMMKESTRIDPLMHNALRRLRSSGKFRLAALTNNFAPPTARADGADAPSLEEELEHLGILKGANEVKGLFDDYLESAKIGMRKPEEGIFRFMLKHLDVRPEDVVFLDDIGINLKAAQALGIRTIRVFPRSSLPALRSLEKETGVQLVTDAEARDEESRVARKEGAAKGQGKARL